MFILNKKHDLDFKLKLIKEYKEGNIGYDSLSNKYDIYPSQLKTWTYQFDTFGINGLISSMTRKKYSTDEKLRIIQYRITNQLSYKETARIFEITNPTLIAQWQMKYNQYGILGLESKPKGRASKTMKNKKVDNTSLNESERQELIRLREENRRLEIAIALEKKLQSLARKNQTKK
ncbi:helix-turn-helix domain-containing protein [Macrococcoides caseolyticum]|uniref:helix-turn-helix domain-containing protein n=9 Tax=Macrococcoides caseolyticum TaxID=69966 RepID=UPI000A31FE0C|nr:helix-turn-helix domain-containing protein [Macrococcus caseolyticus]MDJ1092105.1 transposase [Macrococcus caseolyticus]MDJ1108508.1 transposase [Macrococcus caseolyticus]PKD97224.1 transposase [Macrococcus caseolyticus]PKE09521.1 transposase [Macrococcus caseolyticus]PKE43026.1 transposase [Macrococcus caseolyticus]